MTVLGAIEAGGTKFICAVGDDQGNIFKEIEIPTARPEQTLKQVITFFEPFRHELKGFGIGSFGPIDAKPTSIAFGRITQTPKPGWQNYNIVDAIQSVFSLPVGFDTDVNTAALGEYHFGLGKNLHNFMYMTVGTGIGAAAMINGKLLNGFDHPEMGHIYIPANDEDDFAGICQYHHRCFEGLASGEAIKKRWRVQSALDLPPIHFAWRLESYYLAMSLYNYMCILSPERIIIGGGVMKQTQLYPTVRGKLIQVNNGYLQLPADLDQFIVAPGLKNRSGVIGALLLAQQAYNTHEAEGKK